MYLHMIGIPLYNFLTESVPYIRSAYPWLYEADIFNLNWI